MSQSQQLQPQDEDALSPQDYGFPADPSSAEAQRWAKQERYLTALAQSGSVGTAAATAEVSVNTAQYWDSTDSWGFKKRKQAALQLFLGKVEAEINRRAIEGIDHPVIYKGEITATYKEYSDNLLMFRAKRLDPAYKDNYQPAPVQQQAVTQIVFITPPGTTPPSPIIIEGQAKPIPEDTR